MSDKIVNIFGSKLELPLNQEVSVCLNNALQEELSDVLVLGLAENGSIFVSSTVSDIGKILFMLETFKFNLLEGNDNEE